MSFFTKSKSQRAVVGDRVSAAVDQVTAVINQSMRSSDAKTLARVSLATENFSETEARDLEEASNNLFASLESLFSGSKALKGYNATTGTMAAIMAGDPMKYVSTPVSRQIVQTRDTVAVENYFGNSNQEKLSPIFEQYDDRDNRNVVTYSSVYNAGINQDEFGEAYFPTIPVPPDNVGLAVTARLIQVYNDKTRDATGNLTNFEFRNIIRAPIDPTILKSELTRIVPVYRAGGATDSTKYFSTVVPAAPIVVDGESITTAPLKCGTTFDLLGISQTDSMLASGLNDATDAVDPSASLQSLYVKLDHDVVKFNVKNIVTSNFVASPQGDNRLMVLNFQATLAINAKTTNADLTPLVDLATVVTNKLLVKVSLNVSGNMNLGQQTPCTVFGNTVTVQSVQNQDGELLDLTASPASDVVAAFRNATIDSFDILAYRANTNRRNRGQLIDTRYFTQVYNLKLHSPLTVLRPVTSDGQTDTSDLTSLVAATRALVSNRAVDRMIEVADLLREQTDARDLDVMTVPILGQGRFYVKPTFLEANLDMAVEINSLRSADRAIDTQQLMINKIRDMAYRLYRDSGYGVALDSVYGGAAPIPTVIIGADPVMARYLSLDGELRTLGEKFGCKVVTTWNELWTGKISIAFGIFDGESEAKPNPLHFGNLGWKPALTLVLPIARNGQISKELCVQPCFDHIVNTPVLGMINVSNIESVIASNVPLNTHSV